MSKHLNSFWEANSHACPYCGENTRLYLRQDDCHLPGDVGAECTACGGLWWERYTLVAVGVWESGALTWHERPKET